MILYIDESGDLGFDFQYPKTTRIFVMTALVCEDAKTDLSITKAVRKTIKNKSASSELKGSSSTLSIKKYFLSHISVKDGWKLYSVIFDKTSWSKNQKKKIDKNAFYDEVTGHLLKQINFLKENHPVYLVIDKSKNQGDIEIFNKRIINIMQTLINYNKIHLEIKHRPSQAHPGLQAADLFCWGIRRKHQYRDEEWYSMFANRIATEAVIKL